MATPSDNCNTLLDIVQHNIPFKEKVTRDGIQREVHVVIKNSPFQLQLGLTRKCEVNLNRISFECSLLYDLDGEKGVGFVKSKPITFKCSPSEIGDQVAVEIRINTLSSHCEDMFFKVKIQGKDPGTKQELPGLKLVTGPFKVISKKEQLKKSQPITPNNLTTPPVSTPRNRVTKDPLIEAVARIEKQQACMLERVSQFLPPNKFQRTTEPEAFESSFRQLLMLFHNIDPDHRAEKMRRVTNGLSGAEFEMLTEFSDMLATEALGSTVRLDQPFYLPQSNGFMKTDITSYFAMPNKHAYPEFMPLGNGSEFLSM